MSQINSRARYTGHVTHEGGMASKIGNVEQLRRSVMSTMLWEDGFYEDGEAIADRIVRLTKSILPGEAVEIMMEAKVNQKLRHAPLIMAVALVESGVLTKENVEVVIDRADNLSEFMAMYWKDGRRPIDHQVRKGVALAFKKFDEYQLAKYDRAKSVRLRDVMRMVRPKPENEDQAALWGRLIKGTMKTPDTWEVALSGGADKKEAFTRLLLEKGLGDLAFIRNLRNMTQADVDIDIIRESFKDRRWGRILPFQFVAAARYVPMLEPEIEMAMLKCMEGMDKISGKVVILVDGSVSMGAKISAKSEMARFDAACGLAILARELCEDVTIYRFNDSAKLVPARRGFALRDALGSASGGTEMWNAIRTAKAQGHSRLMIVITDEQTSDNGGVSESDSDLLAIVNVSANQNGVGYGKGSIHINGWSDNVISYLKRYIADV